MLTLDVSTMIHNLVRSGFKEHHLDTDFQFKIFTKKNFSDIPKGVVKKSDGFLKNNDKAIYIMIRAKQKDDSTAPETIVPKIIALIKSSIFADSESTVSLNDSMKQIDMESGTTYFVVGFEIKLSA